MTSRLSAGNTAAQSVEKHLFSVSSNSKITLAPTASPGFACSPVGEVGKPFDFGRHVGQAQESVGGEQPVLAGKDGDGILRCTHGVSLLLIKGRYQE